MVVSGCRPYRTSIVNLLTWGLVVDELATVLVDAVVGQVDEVVLDVLWVVAVGLQSKMLIQSCKERLTCGRHGMKPKQSVLGRI